MGSSILSEVNSFFAAYALVNPCSENSKREIMPFFRNEKGSSLGVNDLKCIAHTL